MKNQYKPMWYIRQQADPTVLDLYIYDAVEGQTWEEGENWWEGRYVESETSANYFRTQLAEHPNVTQINIYISSPGGSVQEGVAIYSQLRRHPAHKTAYVDSFACSIASVIAMAADEVVMPPNTMMFIHNVAMSVYGNARELRKAASDLDAMNAASRQAYLDKAGERLTEEELDEMMEAETWLTAQQCLEYGLCDRIADRNADLSKGSHIVQQVGVNLEQRLAIQRNIAAQLRELTEGGNPPTPPVPTPAPEPELNPTETDPQRLEQETPINPIMALFANFGKEQEK